MSKTLIFVICNLLKEKKKWMNIMETIGNNFKS